MSTVRRSQRLESMSVQPPDPETAKKEQARMEVPPTPISQGKRKLAEVEDGEGAVDDSEAPPRKAQETYVKHEEHWALDGNWLLQIGNTRFKVHRSRLASESGWFQALVERSAGQLDEEYEHREEIDSVLEKAERADGLDLYYLDSEEGPTSEDFARLLDAMNAGIDFVYEEPDLQTVGKLYSAANYFVVRRYENFCSKYLTTRFPDFWKSLSSTPSPDAARGVVLGRDYEQSILRHCFYDLARAAAPSLKPPAGNTGEGDDDSDDDDDDDDDDDPLQELSKVDLILLLHIQKRLSAAWDAIALLVDHKCTGGGCDTHHRAPASVMERARRKYPLDPIFAITHLLDVVKWASHKYCSGAIDAVTTKLKKKREGIWEDLEKWIEESL